jgi:hypothetical protein
MSAPKAGIASRRMSLACPSRRAGEGGRPPRTPRRAGPGGRPPGTPRRPEREEFGDPVLIWRGRREGQKLLLLVFGERQYNARQRELAEDRMKDPRAPRGLRRDVAPSPRGAELWACVAEPPYQGRERRVIAEPVRRGAEARHLRGRLGLPIDKRAPGRRVGEGPPQHVPLIRRQCRPVCPEQPGGPVRRQHVTVPASDIGRIRVETVDKSRDRMRQRFCAEPRSGPRHAAAERMQVRPIGGRHAQRPRDRLEHLPRRSQVPGLLEEGVVGGRHPGEVGYLFPAKAPRAPPVPGGQPDIGGLKPVSPRAKQIGEFASPSAARRGACCRR